MIPTNSLRVCSVGERPALHKGEILCTIGRDVEIDLEALEDYCFQLISDEEYELVLLAGVIAFADRTVRRVRTQGWCRRFRIVMPVSDPHRWNQLETQAALRDALEYLTGDCWDFDFIGRPDSWNKARQNILPLGSGQFVVVPYSAGLDSFAQSQLLKLDAKCVTPIRITAWNRSISGCREWMSDSDGSKYRRVSIPVKVLTGNHPEPSYRTRSFLFLVFAGIAAKLARAKSIVIPENGQGSLGPSLVPFGAESPQRGSHPAFTRRLARFFEALWSEPITFEHPQLWWTKGEVLLRLKKEGLIDGWQNSKSCPRDRRDVTLGGRDVQCGVCSGCLLRRMSAFTAGLSEDERTYLWSKLDADSLEAAMDPKANRKTRKNDFDIASHGVLAMAELANVGTSPHVDSVIDQGVFELSDKQVGDVQVVASRLRRLLLAHQNEWNQFTNHLSPRSWINSNLGNL